MHPLPKFVYTDHGEREHVLSFGLRSGHGRRKKKGARQARLLNEERKREKVCENKRCSREKKRHLKKLLKMKEVCFLSLQMVTLYVLFVDSLNNHFCVVLHSIVKTTMEVMETRLQLWLSFI